MGQATDRVAPGPTAAEVGERVKQARARLEMLVSELDQRRHVVTHAKQAMGNHPLPTIAAGLVGLAAIAGGVYLAVSHHRERSALRARVARLRQALARMIDNPKRVASSGGTVPGKILAAAGSAVASLVVKKLLSNAVRPPEAPGTALARSA